MFSLSSDPFRNCLPGTELLQSPFRTEFSMGLLSWRYQWYLRHHRRFLRSYRRSLRRLADADADRCTTNLTSRFPLWWYTLWHVVKHHEPLVKHHETLAIQCDDICARRGYIGARSELLIMEIWVLFPNLSSGVSNGGVWWVLITPLSPLLHHRPTSHMLIIYTFRGGK